MSTITMDFRHNYQRGERRDSDQDTYQWDLGHVLEIYVPVTATYEIHYCRPGFTETEDYAVESCTASDDGGYKLTAHVPNKYFEESGRLQLFVVGSADNHIITTYEGYINIISRVKPDDYTDDDPENGAISILAKAREYANQSEAWAVGEIEGEAVPSTAPQYHNNSEYYSGLAAGSASDASDSAGAASGSASSASTNALKAEGHAVGKQNGTDVGSGSDYYHDNAKYYAGQAAESAIAASGSAGAASGSASAASTNALKAEGFAVGKQNGTDVASGSDYYHNNAAYYAGQASGSALDAQAWSEGKRGSTDVPSTDPQYHNSAKYWAQQAIQDYSKVLGDFARVEAEAVATKNYTSGEYLVLNGYLYVTTDTITSGASLVEGTNIEKTTVGEELEELNSKTFSSWANITNPYTATTDGFARLTMSANAGASDSIGAYILVDGVEVMAITASYGGRNGGVVPVAKGSKVQYNQYWYSGSIGKWQFMSIGN